MEILNYIRNLFSFTHEPTKKRSHYEACSDLELFSSPKFRKIQTPMSRHFDDIIIGPDIIRRPVRSPRNLGISKDETIVIEDENPRNRLRKKYTSTPAYKKSRDNSFQDDDVKFIAEFKSPIGRNSHRNEHQLSRPFSLLQNLLPDRRIESNTFKRTIPKIELNGNVCSAVKRQHLSSTSTRLEDKKEYQRILERHLSRENSLNNSSQYFTPDSRLSKYDFSGRAGKILELSRQSSKNDCILELSRQSSKNDCIDLTHEDANGSSSSGKMKVRDKIMKVLNSYDDEPVEIQDSESDVEILPNPPSPKPDIHVDPINSMKTVVDTSYVSNKTWLSQLVESHRKKIDERYEDIKRLTESKEKLNAINRDIRIGNLTKQIDKCLQIKEAILPIEESEPELPQLTQEQYAIVEKAFRGNPNEVLVKKFNLNITRKDILTLAGLNWLNDEVINFYMNLIMERSTQDAKRFPKAYCFNTFFYPKLLRDGPESLRRWTRRVDIFSMDIICAPIHLGVHWCMAIIDLRKKTIKYYDSMGSSNQKCLNALKNYLEKEHLDKKKTAYDTSAFQLESVKDIPQQMNGSDCGMFSCTFAEFYSRDAKFTFKQEDMPYLRTKMVLEIITGELLIK